MSDTAYCHDPQPAKTFVRRGSAISIAPRIKRSVRSIEPTFVMMSSKELNGSQTPLLRLGLYLLSVFAARFEIADRNFEIGSAIRLRGRHPSPADVDLQGGKHQFGQWQRCIARVANADEVILRR